MMKRVGLSVPAIRRMHDDRLRLYGEMEALRGRVSVEQSPFRHYNACFDAEGTMRRHAVPDLRPTPGYVTNFLGVLIDPRHFPGIPVGEPGTIEPIPIPANWHADIAEWAAALRAVELSGSTFRMLELGCGWGCWMNNTGAAARRLGKVVELTGIEGEAGGLGLAREALATNGFRGSEIRLVHGVAAARARTALFPRQAVAGSTWGLEPVFDAGPEEVTAAEAAGTHDVVPVVALEALVGETGQLDLLHVDIQGGEADLVDGAAATLTRSVRCLLIGTHSREIEGRLFERLRGEGWRLEIERPAILSLDGPEPTVLVDGVQGSRNPAL